MPSPHNSTRAKCEVSNSNLIGETEDYYKILDVFNISYRMVGYHLEVGDLYLIQGWILHISIIKTQIEDLLKAILPLLTSSNVAFKVVRDKYCAQKVLDGDLDRTQVGKIVTIYPEDSELLIKLSKSLIKITERFKGPSVPSDFHLGGNIYTRYGAFKGIRQIDEKGKEKKYITDSHGNLTPDIVNVPFILPSGLEWPFSSVCQYSQTTELKTLKKLYRIIRTIKHDAKGDVYKALYVSGLFRLKWCIIKQGRRHMWCDENERGMDRRLSWQYYIADKLNAKVPLPKRIDLFEEQNDSYLVLEFIKGESLISRLAILNKDYSFWQDMPLNSISAILTYLLKAIFIIKTFHQNGFVHRDITPVNFLVDRNDNLYSIDNELAYEIHSECPDAPFGVGTAGFMSPEQESSQSPSIKEDIYGLGALIIMMLTGIHPLHFTNMPVGRLRNSLNFYFGYEVLSKVISKCISSRAEMRPDIEEIEIELTKYKATLSNLSSGTMEQNIISQSIDRLRLESAIQSSLLSLTTKSIQSIDGIWLSRIPSTSRLNEKESEGFTPTAGFFEGAAGVIYFLGKAQEYGFDIKQSVENYVLNVEYFKDHFLMLDQINSLGLYGGKIGIALALSVGMSSGLISRSDELASFVSGSFNSPNSDINDISLASGATGCAIALIQCRSEFEPAIFEKLLMTYANSMAKFISNKKRRFSSGLEYGVGGAIIFLMKVLKYYHIPGIELLIEDYISKLEKHILKLIKICTKCGLRHLFEKDPLFFDELKGAILIYLKASDTFNKISFKDKASTLLYLLPKRILHNNFSQEFGLSDLGEVYLEAYRAIGEIEWLNRANWIGEALLHTCSENEAGSIYWPNRNSRSATADFMVGNTGIIHFLMKLALPGTVGYRLIDE